MMMSSAASIQIKGIRDSLLVTLSGENFDEVRSTLLAAVDERPSFFQGARMVLDMGGLALKVADLSPLRDVLSERGISLWAVLSESPQTEQTAQILGLATRLAKPAHSEPKPAGLPENGALWVEHTVRSGQKVTSEGNVVIIGDVNPGAEILAGGSIIVWGRLRGVVHAGAQGDEKAMVCALELNPTQLRIAGEIAISPERKGKSRPEIARLVDGVLQAEPWQA